jgi:rare lipoprotein A
MHRTFSLLACLTVLLLGGSLLSGFVVARLEEFGKAGYYSDSLQGRKTASGEKYDKNELTCAHKTLPFGTKVRVTRLDNEKSVVVRVNDRGPYAQGYVIDISRRAAENIGLIRDGVTRVRLDVIDEQPAARRAEEPPVVRSLPANAGANPASTAASRSASAATTPATNTVLLKRHQGTAAAAATPATYSTTTTPSTAKGKSAAAPAAAADDKKLRTSELYLIDITRPAKRGFGVQLSTLYDANNVMSELARVNKIYPGRVLVNIETSEGTDERPAYKIILGPFDTRATAETRQREAARKGFRQCFVVDLSDLQSER